MPRGQYQYRKNGYYWFVDTYNVTRWIKLESENSCIFSEKSDYQLIEIYKTVPFGRMLVLDGVPQCAESDEAIYHEALIHPAMVMRRYPADTILILGGGDLGAIREILRYRSVKKVVLVDIDEMVIRAVRKFMPFMLNEEIDHERVTILNEDANEFIKDPVKFLPHGPGRFDVIYSDLTDFKTCDGESSSASFYRSESFEHIKKLSDFFVMQAEQCSRLVQEDHFNYRQMVGSSFPRTFSYRRMVPSFGAEWSFIMATNDRHMPDPLTMPEGYIDSMLQARIGSKLEEYSGKVHRHLFSLSPSLEGKLEI